MRRAGLLLAAAILCLALTLLVQQLDAVRATDVVRAVRSIPAHRLWLCVLLTGVSFVALGGYDCIAVRLVAPRRVSLLRAWFAGAVANSLANTLGFHALTATAVRYRLYARCGLSAWEITRLTSLSWSSLALGFAAMFALALAASPAAGPAHRLGGLALLALLALGGMLAGIRQACFDIRF